MNCVFCTSGAICKNATDKKTHESLMCSQICKNSREPVEYSWLYKAEKNCCLWFLLVIVVWVTKAVIQRNNSVCPAFASPVYALVSPEILELLLLFVFCLPCEKLHKSSLKVFETHFSWSVAVMGCLLKHWVFAKPFK